MIENLALGLSVAMTFHNLGFAFIGCVIGTAIGVLPGIGPLATIALLLPLTFALDPITALIMLSGIYYGAQYGGSTSAILLNLPGEVTAVVTTLEGHKMAKRGRAGAALATAAIGSFFAGTVATLVVAASGPLLTNLALSFGPAEYFSLILLGLIIATVLAQGSIFKSIAMLVLGVALGLVGTDVQSGQVRFSFGFFELFEGIDFVAVAMGIFGVAEIIRNLEHPENRSGTVATVGSLMLTKEEFKRATPSVIRGTIVGSILGILPGGGLALSTFASYMLERKVSKYGHEFGTGAIEGVAGPESANNAASQTSFIPMLTLGIPANAVMALMIGGLMIHGIQPGPGVIQAQPALFWGLIVSMWIGNLMLLVINLPLIGMWVSLLRLPYKYLYPAILVFCAIGVYSVNYSPFNVFETVLFGFLGYLFFKLALEPAPLLIGFVLGPMLEEYLRRAMVVSRGSAWVFVERPVSAVLLAIAALALGAMLLPSIRRKKDQALEE
ncbi:tripartite tricarboxylate transporter permease (plasmid) [Rhizobium ruizarguesonis]|uniref:tripartite tricarboxylate transporter permease n=1 Tax=Rhizobium ruizarguesonis TaxID=2081791 RepID=UPI001030C7B9|nr:tripartite tricarboxylate transporter permease [Rhizobium ruizarguesonis]TBB18592.1 tripartite tricarboxylate transporter permease [Rhizobium ruizarguesonis]